MGEKNSVKKKNKEKYVDKKKYKEKINLVWFDPRFFRVAFYKNFFFARHKFKNKFNQFLYSFFLIFESVGFLIFIFRPKKTQFYHVFLLFFLTIS